MYDFKILHGLRTKSLNSHYASAAVPTWCFQLTTALVHQLIQLAFIGRPSTGTIVPQTPVY